MTNKRIAWVDGVRFLAMAWILFGHFVMIFTPNVEVQFEGILGYVLYGITGKMAVACFCVLLGYFASKPSGKPFAGYVLERYLFFALQILIIESLFYLAFYFVPDQTYLSEEFPVLCQETWPVFQVIFRDAVQLQWNVIPTYWCVAEFVKGSMLIMLAHKAVQDRPFAVRFAVCAVLLAGALYMGETWIAICIMGWMLRLVLEIRIPNKAILAALMIAMLISIPWLIRRDECSETFLLDGVASAFALYILTQLPLLQRVIGNRVFEFLGRHCFEMFLLHTPVYYLAENLLVDLGWTRPPVWGYVIQFAAVYAITALLAVLWQWLAKKTILRPGRWLAGKCAQV